MGDKQNEPKIYKNTLTKMKLKKKKN